MGSTSDKLRRAKARARSREYYESVTRPNRRAQARRKARRANRGSCCCLGVMALAFMPALVAWLGYCLLRAGRRSHLGSVPLQRNGLSGRCS